MFPPLVYAHFASGWFILLCTLTLLVDGSSSCVRFFCLPMLDHHVYAYSADGPHLLHVQSEDSQVVYTQVYSCCKVRDVVTSREALKKQEQSQLKKWENS